MLLAQRLLLVLLSGEGEGASTEVDVLGVNPISLSSSGITDGFITDRFKGRTPREMIAAGPLSNNLTMLMLIYPTFQRLILISLLDALARFWIV